MRHRWCRLCETYIRGCATLRVYPISLEGVAIIIKLQSSTVLTPLDQPGNRCPRGSRSTLLDLNPLPFSVLFLLFSLTIRSKSIREKSRSSRTLFETFLSTFSPSHFVSFKCLERACRSILRERLSAHPTDKSNSPRHEGLPFRQRHNGKCDFSPSSLTSSQVQVPDKEGAAIPVEAERMKSGGGGGKKGREKKGEEKAERGNITGKSATREAANSQKGYFNLMSVNRITFRLSQAAVAATNTCSLHAIADCLVSCPLSTSTIPLLLFPLFPLRAP